MIWVKFVNSVYMAWPLSTAGVNVCLCPSKSFEFEFDYGNFPISSQQNRFMKQPIQLR